MHIHLSSWHLLTVQDVLVAAAASFSIPPCPSPYLPPAYFILLASHHPTYCVYVPLQHCILLCSRNVIHPGLDPWTWNFFLLPTGHLLPPGTPNNTTHIPHWITIILYGQITLYPVSSLPPPFGIPPPFNALSPDSLHCPPTSTDSPNHDGRLSLLSLCIRVAPNTSRASPQTTGCYRQLLWPVCGWACSHPFRPSMALRRHLSGTSQPQSTRQSATA